MPGFKLAFRPVAFIHFQWCVLFFEARSFFMSGFDLCSFFFLFQKNYALFLLRGYLTRRSKIIPHYCRDATRELLSGLHFHCIVSERRRTKETTRCCISPLRNGIFELAALRSRTSAIKTASTSAIGPTTSLMRRQPALSQVIVPALGLSADNTVHLHHNDSNIHRKNVNTYLFFL